jgi:hypothetical protein
VSEVEPVFDADASLPLSVRDGLTLKRWKGPVFECTVPLAVQMRLAAIHHLPGPGRFDEVGKTTRIAFRQRTWLVLGDPEAAIALPEAILIDQSHGKLVLMLKGVTARALLTRGCRIDLRDKAFPQGAAATTMIGQITTTLLCDKPGRAYRLVVGSSFAHALVGWVRRTAEHLPLDDVKQQIVY